MTTSDGEMKQAEPEKAHEKIKKFFHGKVEPVVHWIFLWFISV